MSRSNFFNSQFLIEELGLITQARIRIFTLSILSFISLFLIFFVLHVLKEQNLLMLLMGLLLSLLIVVFVALIKWTWLIAAHLFMRALTILIISNILFFFSGINSLMVQYSILILALSYYLLGRKWRAIYSSINIILIIVVSPLDNYHGIALPTQHLHINNDAYAIVLIFNYFILTYTHYSFFVIYYHVHRKETKLKEHLKRAVVIVKDMAEAKINFLSTMSRGLITPLNAGIGITNIMMMDATGKTEIENLNTLKFSAENLISTVNDILDFNKIEKKNLLSESNSFRLMDLLVNIHGAFKAQANSKGIDLQFDIDPLISNLTVIDNDKRLANRKPSKGSKVKIEFNYAKPIIFLNSFYPS